MTSDKTGCNIKLHLYALFGGLPSTISVAEASVYQQDVSNADWGDNMGRNHDQAHESIRISATGSMNVVTSVQRSADLYSRCTN